MPVRITGRGGIPAHGVSAVAVHVSVTAAAKHGAAKSPGGTVLVAPLAAPGSHGAVDGALGSTTGRTSQGAAPQQAHLVAYDAGATTDGFALVGVGTAGELLVTNQGPAAVAVSLDVQGYAAGQWCR
jgi:hypothetical protein